MAPSPENDSAPKAPDKSGDKTRSDGQENFQQKECGTADGESKVSLSENITLRSV